MTDNQPLDTAVNYEIKETVDSDKSFESCLNSVNDGINNIKDDESEKSFISCSINTQDKSKVNDLLNVGESSQDNRTEENTDDYDDDDDNIRPGSCRENASSDDDVSSWDENNDQWIYDTEYIQQSGNNKDQIKTELTNKEIKSCEKDLEYIIENHVSKENLKDSSNIKYKNNQDNPTFIPTNGKFFMHDLRLEDAVKETTRHNKNSKNLKNENVHRWSHDLYDEAKQKPISKLELIKKYGEDIRSKTNDQENNKNKSKKKSKRNNYKRKNYRYQQAYYDYDYYDNYNQHYYNNDYYFDYSYYGNQYNSWGRSNKIPYNNSRENNRDIQHLQYDNRSYKSNSLPTSNKKIKQQKPPSKYSQIAEFTDIKITVDNIGARQIKSLNNSSIKNSTKVLENSMFHRSSDSSSQQCPVNSTIKNQDYSESYKDISFHNKQTESLRGNKKVISHHEIIKNNSNPKFQGDFNSQRVKSSNKVEASSKNSYEKNYGDYFQFNRHKSVPEWVNSKFEWEENKDFKNSFEEMPPLTDKEINQLQKRSFHAHIAPPRFSRDKSVNISNEAKGQNRVQSMSHVPKRYSEVRNQFETPKVVPNESTPAAMVTNSSEMINYQQIIPNMDYYGNLQPLLLNLNQGPAHSASNNSPQQSIQQMMSLPSLLQTGGYSDNPQFYIQSVYLPPNGRLNQYSQPFQPSYVPQSQNTMFKIQTSASASNNTSNIQSQNSRPVTGKS